MSRPIPIRSPRDAQTMTRGATKGVSQSLPVPASPHIGSLKAPPEYLSGMPPLSLPMSYQENENIRMKKDVMAKSAPAADLQPLHRYQVEDKRKRRTSVDQTGSSLKSASLMASSLSASMRLGTNTNQLPVHDEVAEEDQASLAHSLSQSLGASLSALRIREMILEDEAECESPEQSEPKGILLTELQRQVGIISPSQKPVATAGATAASVTAEMGQLDLDASGAGDEDVDEDDDELQFELS